MPSSPPHTSTIRLTERQLLFIAFGSFTIGIVTILVWQMVFQEPPAKPMGVTSEGTAGFIHRYM